MNMLKRSFFNLAKPQFEYESLRQGKPGESVKIAIPKTVTLFLKKPYEPKQVVKIGDKVKTGQKLSIYENCDEYVISSVTGTISSITPYTGNFGQFYTAVSIDADEKEEIDEEFKTEGNIPSLNQAQKFLSCVPGYPNLNLFSQSPPLIKTLVVLGIDSDLMVTTNQYVMKTQTDAISKGISILKKITGVEQVIVALPQNLVKETGAIGGASGVELRNVSPSYPSALPRMIMKDLLGQTVPQEKSCEDMGVCFLNAETVAAIAKAFQDSNIPVTKTLTVVKKDASKVWVEARIGTPIRDICTSCDVSLNERDRIIAGGLLTGESVYSEDHPVQPDTDAIIIQDGSTVSWVSDYPCTNCGECVRICPVKIPVNMLVRLCEAGQYEEAADQYNLYACIECGLCSLVCVSRMPVFQYIRLAKYELDRIRIAEEEAANA